MRRAGASPSTMLVSLTVAALAALLLPLGPVSATLQSAVPTSATKRHHRARAFTVHCRPRVPLRPGSTERLNLALTNRRRFTLWVRRLTIRVSVDRRHRARECSVRRDFAVRQLRRSAYPIRLRRRTTRRLSALGVRVLPRVAMRDFRRVNQDACKGATLRLRYRGSAVRRRRTAR
jgi:hypothetical protein